ncbi:MAG: undecaprenyl-diphosphate phosphatase [Aigarchaeota archaeon]|nr:undecaprenyl-diphosphate phosphatase [Candidatus Wolframiiraptor gerlachensis]
MIPALTRERVLKGYEELLLGVAAGSAQGVFEWLPVSSKTILLLIFYLAGLHPSTAYLLSLFLNGSTAAAAIAYFRRDILKMVRGLAGDEEGVRLLKFILASIIATGLAAPPLALLVAESLEHLDRLSMTLVGALYIIMSILLWRGGRMKDHGNRAENFRPYRDGLLAGLAQGLSALPGISRSGITILALLALGKSPQTALRLSFIMSIPATIGGSAYMLLLNQEITGLIQAAALITATATAAALSLIAIAALLRASQKLKPHMLTTIMAAITLLTALIPAQNP